MKTWKRALALVLALVMALSLVALPSFAEGEDEKDTYDVIINYVFANDQSKQAADPWTATVKKGDTLNVTVTSPAVVGYTPSQAQVTFNKAINKDTTVTVTYTPAIVNFTVVHYQQNVNDDNYTQAETEKKTGQTDDYVGASLAKTYDGFYALPYENVRIAADGSTVVEVYYDRNYYLMDFTMNGGYGVEPIYARYGTPIASVGTPVRAGYTFASWTPDLTLPATMPAQNTTYAANWTASNVQYRVQYWQENANDSGYSYVESQTETAKAGAVVSGETYKNSKSYNGFTYHHADTNVTVAGDGSTVVNVYFNRNLYTVTFKNGQQILTCGKEEHSHTYTGSYKEGGFLGIGAKTYYYGGCYPAGGDGYGGATKGNTICGKEEHTHSSRCYTTSDLTITAKYGAFIGDQWPGNGWYVDTSEETAQSYLAVMPLGGKTFYGQQTGSNTATATYYVEVLPGESGTMVSGKTYKVHHTDTAKSDGNLTVTDEERYDLEGFTCNKAISTKNEAKYDGSKFYYTRNSYTLVYNDQYGTPREEQLPYEQVLSKSVNKSYVPAYPKGLEAGAYEFAGWYLDPEGTRPVDWNAKMPAAKVVLYAKWAPKTHTVKTYLNEEAMNNNQQLGDTQTVEHRAQATEPTLPETDLQFVSWFYKDENGVEHAFNFSMAVTRDLNLYAKWSSTILKTYTVHYVLASDGVTKIADDTTGSALVGNTKTFYAKGDTDLYPDYREGYYPDAVSKSLTVSADGTNEITFYYTVAEAVPYTVRYLDKATGNPVHEAKLVSDNRKAVVTEKALTISGYVADEYQKTLVVTINGENVITFWYTRDEAHAIVYYAHHVRNIDGTGYDLYTEGSYKGDVGTYYEEGIKDIPGFTFEYATVNGVRTDKAPGAALTTAGLELELYYTRNNYTYTVRHIDSSTNKDIVDPVTKSAPFGKTVAEPAKNFDGYRLNDSVSQATQQITIRVDETLNVITFYYVPVFYVQHIQGGQNKWTETYDVKDGFNLTDKVNLKKDGSIVSNGSFLYGGTFRDAEGYTKVADFNGGNPTSFTPVRGMTYCIWEPDAAVYLMPKSLSGWEHVWVGKELKLDVNSFYLVAPVDRTYYKVVGFTVNGEVDVRDTDTDMDDQGARTSAIYESIVLPKKDGSSVTYGPTAWSLSSTDLLGCAMADVNLWKDTTKTISYVPYWVTLDGVKVTGAASRTYQYVENTKGLERKDEVSLTSTCTYTPDEPNNAPMRLLSAYIADSTQYTVTFHDNGVETAVTVRPGSAASCQPAGVSGKLFAGWYADADCTQPADLTAVEQDMDVYAKYVSDSYLTVKYNKIGLFRPTGVNLITAVDSENFAEVGFVINGEKVPVSDYTYRYRLIFTAGSLFGGDVARKAPMVTMGYSFNGAKSVTVAPYWVTNDGTTVTGAARTLTVSGWSIKG